MPPDNHPAALLPPRRPEPLRYRLTTTQPRSRAPPGLQSSPSRTGRAVTFGAGLLLGARAFQGLLRSSPNAPNAASGKPLVADVALEQLEVRVLYLEETCGPCRSRRGRRPPRPHSVIGAVVGVRVVISRTVTPAS